MSSFHTDSFIWTLKFINYITVYNEFTDWYAPGPGPIFFSGVSRGAFGNETEGEFFILELNLIYVTLYLPTSGTCLLSWTKLAK